MSAINGASIQLGPFEIARKMNLDNETDVEKLRQSVVEELNREDYWLMILDNVDDVDLAKSILSERRENSHAHVLITTRDDYVCAELSAKKIHLDVMIQKAVSIHLELI